jgi:Amiloride-sensitive sodium channel
VSKIPETSNLVFKFCFSFAVFTVTFRESQFVALHRSELYGITELLASCGGLLGLFLGFSFMPWWSWFIFSLFGFFVTLGKEDENNNVRKKYVCNFFVNRKFFDLKILS